MTGPGGRAGRGRRGRGPVGQGAGHLDIGPRGRERGGHRSQPRQRGAELARVRRSAGRPRSARRWPPRPRRPLPRRGRWRASPAPGGSPTPWSPIRWLAGTATSSRTTSPSTCGAMIWCGLLIDKPGALAGTRTREYPSPSRPRTQKKSASPSVGDEGLVAGDNQLVAALVDRRGDRLEVRADVGLGEGERGDGLEARDLRQPALAGASGCPAADSAKLPMPCMANSESRWALSAASCSRTTVTARESTCLSRPPKAAGTTTPPRPLRASSSRACGYRRDASSASAAIGTAAAARSAASRCSARYSAGSSKSGGHDVTRGGRWSNERPNISDAIRVRWMAGVPPAIAQPWASRCSISIPYSSV